MSQPSPDYERNYSFTDHSTQQPNVPQPGSWLDIEFNEIKDILNNTGSRLSEIQRDDGKLKGDAFDTYTYDQIAENVAISLNLESNYATKLYVNSQGFATQSYVTSRGYITSSELTDYATQSYVTSRGYITSSALSPYLETSIAQSTFITIATAASTYQPISEMSLYATKNWVESQGYLTGSLNYLPLTGGTVTGAVNFWNDVEISTGYLIVNDNPITARSGVLFGDGNLQTAAGLPLTGGTLTGSVVFGGATFGDNLGISADANDGNSHTGFNLSTNNGVSGSMLQISWGNYGEDYVHQTTLSQLSLNHYSSELDVSTSYNLDGIHFPDSTTQTTAGIPEAPIDGNYYVRKDGQWYQCIVHTQGGHNYLTI